MSTRLPAQQAIGKTFGLMKVLSVQKVGKEAMAVCVCRCGIKKTVRVSHLRKGSIVSCSCARTERFTKFATKHGLRFTPEYEIWLQVVQRCTNPKNRGYKNYGGRGIILSPRWRKFENFITDMGKRPYPRYSLERKNNEKGYSKDNCKWATRGEQASNTRKNVWLVYRGVRLHLAAWARKQKINNGTLYSRIVIRRWPVVLALTARPPHFRRSH